MHISIIPAPFLYIPVRKNRITVNIKTYFIICSCHRTTTNKEKKTMTHQDVWLAIDTFAREHKMSCSGLAKRSGLDPTTFNKSKRWSKYGQPRWPSTNSIAKILDATGATLNDFIKYFAPAAQQPDR